MNTNELNELKSFCRILADESAAVIKKYFRTNISIDSKSDESPVTIADKTAEMVMRKLIADKYPSHGIIGEEHGAINSDSDYQWVLDPIDGTKSFISGAHTFGTLIALVYKGEPVLGVINQPILNEFLIGDNETAELNGKPVKVRECKDISETIFLTTDHFNVHKYQNGEKFDSLMNKVKLYRHWGDCYGYLLVACGFADAMMDPIMNYWDKIALIPIIKGAGGIITDYQGGDPVKGESTIAASPVIHSELIKLLN